MPHRILLIYFKVISKKGVTIAPAYPTNQNVSQFISSSYNFSDALLQLRVDSFS